MKSNNNYQLEKVIGTLAYYLINKFEKWNLSH